MSFIALVCAGSGLLPFLSNIFFQIFDFIHKKCAFFVFQFESIVLNPSESLENIFLVFWIFTFQQTIV